MSFFKDDLKKYGITGVKEVVYNPSYDQLFMEETDPSLTGYDKGQVTELGAVNVMTGVYTGRSPKDKFFVLDDTSKDTVWWTTPEYKNDNKPLFLRTAGRKSRRSLPRSSPTRISSMLWMLSAAPTRTPASRSVS